MQTPKALLSTLESTLEKKIKAVNRSIQKGQNKDMVIKKKPSGANKWSLPYVAKETTPQHQLYQQLPLTNIFSILKWANQKTAFISAFQHILNTGTNKKAEEVPLFAAIIALGTNHGLSLIHI